MHTRITSILVAVALAVLCFACEREPAAVAHAEAPAVTGKAVLGKPAPAFTLTDTEGKAHKLSELRGKTVVLEWFNPDCPFVKFAHEKGPLVAMAKQVESPSVVWLAVNSSAPTKQGHGVARNREAKAAYKLTHPVLLDESGQVGHAYGATKTPHMFVIDPKGVLVYQGGLDNAPIGTVDDERPRPADSKPGELVPYVKNALADVAQKRPVSLAETPAYGCSVKYGD